MDFWLANAPSQSLQYSRAPGQSNATYSGEGDMSFQWFGQGSSDAELLDAAGGVMMQGSSDSLGQVLNFGSWNSV